MPYSYSREQELSNDVWNPLLPLTMLWVRMHTLAPNNNVTQHTTHPHLFISFSGTTMPWECFECTFVQEGSPSGRGPCIMCMHDNPLRIKVEVEDASASPSLAPKITGTDVKMKDLMSDVASMKALAEAVTE